MKGKKVLYIVSGSCERGGVSVKAGRRRWFGPMHFGGYPGFANFVETRSLRHANAQYRRLKIADRQMDVRVNRKARVLKWGAMR